MQLANPMAISTKILAISGVDGCGKTTVIRALEEALAADGRSCRVVWMRYNHYLSRLLLVFCRLIGLTRYEKTAGGRVGYHNFYRSRLVSSAFVALTYIDTVLASVVCVYVPAWLGSKLVICDRWIVDIMVDLEVATGIRFSRQTIVGRMFLALSPDACRCVIVERPVESLLVARPESRFDRNFERRCQLYQRHSADPSVRLVENTRDVPTVVGEILPIVGKTAEPDAIIV